MDNKPVHTPKAHEKHGGGVPCDCATDLSGDISLIRCLCGAAYVAAEVFEFPTFYCYDCNHNILLGCTFQPGPEENNRFANVYARMCRDEPQPAEL